MKFPATIHLIVVRKPLSKAMKDGHLVAVKKDVHRDGKVFQQTRYVKPGEAKGHLKPGRVWQIHDKPGISKQHANKHFEITDKHESKPDHYNVRYEDGKKATVHSAHILQHASPVEGKSLTDAKKDAKAAGVQPLFMEDEIKGLNPKATQPFKDKGELYQKSAEALDHLKMWLNAGKGVCDKLGYQHMHGGMDDVNWGQKGGMLFIAPLKGEKRAAEKVRDDYDGDWSKLCDVVRASVAVDTLEELHSTLHALKQSGLQLAKPPKDRFSKPTDVGYRDCLLNVKFPNGTIGELQLHVKPMLAAKEEGHKPYELIRSLEGKYKADESTGRRLKPAEEWADHDRYAYHQARRASLDIYHKSWRQIIKGDEMHKAKPDSGKAGKFTYYEYDGAIYRKFNDQDHVGIDQVRTNDGWATYKGNDGIAPVYYGDRIEEAEATKA